MLRHFAPQGVTHEQHQWHQLEVGRQTKPQAQPHISMLLANSYVLKVRGHSYSRTLSKLFMGLGCPLHFWVLSPQQPALEPVVTPLSSDCQNVLYLCMKKQEAPKHTCSLCDSPWPMTGRWDYKQSRVLLSSWSDNCVFIAAPWNWAKVKLHETLLDI